MDEMEIINLHKKCNKKARKVSQPKKASESSKSDETKNVSGPIDDPSDEGQKPKKASSDGKKTAAKPGKKLPHSLKKHQSHLNLLIQTGKKKKGRRRTIKGKNTSFAWSERRSPKFS